MSYDLHVVRTNEWTTSSENPVTKDEVDRLIAGDPELMWSTTDYVDMENATGEIVPYYMISWRGHPCFWWYRDQIQCSGPDESQQIKLIQIAERLNAFAVGDDGEHYKLKAAFFGKKKIIVFNP